MAFNLSRSKGLKYLVIRPFNIYGPNMDIMTNYGRVIPNFCIWGLKGEPFRIHGDGTQIRSFCYIEDFLNAITSLLNNNINERSINIGYPHPISILELGRLTFDILGLEEKFQFVEKYPLEPYIRVPDIKLIEELTGWNPNVNLRSGLKRTIRWFKDMGLEKYDRYH